MSGAKSFAFYQCSVCNKYERLYNISDLPSPDAIPCPCGNRMVPMIGLNLECEGCGNKETKYVRNDIFLSGDYELQSCAGKECNFKMIIKESFYFLEDRGYKPKKGERFLTFLTKEMHSQRMNSFIDEHWDSGDYPLKERYKNKMSAMKKYKNFWAPKTVVPEIMS